MHFQIITQLEIGECSKKIFFCGNLWVQVVSNIEAKKLCGCQWLLPSEAGYLEAEGLEDTRHFSQEAIVKEVDVTSARKAFDLQLPGW